MAKSRQHKAESRKAILDSAARLFRERGVEGVTVAEVMQDAGLTHGGFPRHFSSKQELVTEALAAVFQANQDAPILPTDSLQVFAAAYLRPQHREAVGRGCAFAALGSELVRAPDHTRATLTAEIRRQIDELAKTTSRERAIGAWSAMVGAMMLARIADNEAFSDEILNGTKACLGAGWLQGVPNSHYSARPADATASPWME